MSYLGQLSQLVGVQEQLLQTAAVAVDLIGHRSERAVPLIHGLNVTVTPPQRDTLQHVPEHSAPPHRGLTQAAKRWDTGWYCRLATPLTLSSKTSQIKAPAPAVLLQMCTNSSDGRGHPEDHTQAELLSTFTAWFNISQRKSTKHTFYVLYSVLQHKQPLVELHEILSHGISDSYRGVQIRQTRWFMSRALLSNMFCLVIIKGGLMIKLHRVHEAAETLHTTLSYS